MRSAVYAFDADQLTFVCIAENPEPLLRAPCMGSLRLLLSPFNGVIGHEALTTGVAHDSEVERSFALMLLADAIGDCERLEAEVRDLQSKVVAMETLAGMVHDSDWAFLYDTDEHGIKRMIPWFVAMSEFMERRFPGIPG